MVAEYAQRISNTEVVKDGRGITCGEVEKNAQTKNRERGEYIVGARLHIIIIVYETKQIVQIPLQETDLPVYA